MPLCVGQMLELVDTHHQPFGHMQMVRQEGTLLFGTFQPGVAFSRVAQLFRDFEAAVEVQALHAIETLDAAIAALGLHLHDPVSLEAIAITDVQIWSDGGMTCRLAREPLVPTPTTQGSASSTQDSEATHRRTKHWS